MRSITRELASSSYEYRAKITQWLRAPSASRPLILIFGGATDGERVLEGQRRYGRREHICDLSSSPVFWLFFSSLLVSCPGVFRGGWCVKNRARIRNKNVIMLSDVITHAGICYYREEGKIATEFFPIRGWIERRRHVDVKWVNHANFARRNRMSRWRCAARKRRKMKKKRNTDTENIEKRNCIID